MLPRVGVQVICFRRFPPEFYSRAIDALAVFIGPSCGAADVTVFVFQHQCRLPRSVRRGIRAAVTCQVRFEALEHTFEAPRTEVDAYAIDVNRLYAEAQAHNDREWVFHVDGDVMPSQPEFVPVAQRDFIPRWIEWIETGLECEAICNIGSRHFEPGPPVNEFYRRYAFVAPGFDLRFSSQSYFCRRELVRMTAIPAMSLEKWVTQKLVALRKRSFVLCATPDFVWRHHFGRGLA